MFLLRHLKPERYGAGASAQPDPQAETAVEASLRAMEPCLPAPAEQLFAPEELAADLEIADIADGTLPHFFREQRPAKTATRAAAEARAAQDARGKAAWDKLQRNEGKLSNREFIDMCRHLDPPGPGQRSKKRYR
jgi:hypothetical protein